MRRQHNDTPTLLVNTSFIGNICWEIKFMHKISRMYVGDIS